MKIINNKILPLLCLLQIGINHISAQEYFDAFYNDEFYYPAYSEYYQDYENPENSRAFLASYTDGIIQFDPNENLSIVDTLHFGHGYIKAFDYEVLGNHDNEVLAVATSEKEVFIYDLNKKEILYQFEVNYLLNDIQFSNISPQIIWGADKRGQLVQINTATKAINYYPIHSKGIARIELFLDKIITSSFDHTIQVTNQLTLTNEQKLKFQVPLLEFDVSTDGIMAIGTLRSVALYSLIDEKWLYGKHLIKKKIKLYEGEKSFAWNPYQNDDEYTLGGVAKKVNFIRRSHIIASSGSWDGIELTHVQNPDQVVYPYFPDTLGYVFTNYIFNQDNHYSFLNGYEIRNSTESGEEPPYLLRNKSSYVRAISEYGGLEYIGSPFSFELEERIHEDVGEFYPDFFDNMADFGFIALDEYTPFGDTIWKEPFLDVSKYRFNHFIPFPTKKIDTVEYTDMIMEYSGIAFIENCAWETNDFEFKTDPLCVLETAWLQRDTGIVLKENAYQYNLTSSFDNGDIQALNAYELLMRNNHVANSEYENGFKDEIVTSDKQDKEEAENISFISKELYSDNVFTKLEQKGHLSKVECFAISPDQKYLATSGQDCKVIIWDFFTGDKLKEIDLGVELGLNEKWRTYDSEWEFGVMKLLFHPVHPWIITSSRNYGSICIDYTSGQIIGEGSPFQFGIISDDGKFLIANGTELFQLPELYYIDSYEGEYVPESSIRGNTKVIEIPNGGDYKSQMAREYIDFDLDVKLSKMYDLSGGFERDFWDYGMSSPSGRWYVLDSVLYDNENDMCWNLPNYFVDDYYYKPIYDIGVFSPDESKLAYMAKDDIKVFDLNTMKVESLKDSTVYKFDAPIQFSPDGKYLVAKVWEILGGELNWLEEANTNRTLGIYNLENMSKLRHHTGHPVEPMEVKTDTTGQYLLFKGPDFMYTLDRENLTIQQFHLEQKSQSYNLNFPKARISIDDNGQLVIEGVVEMTYGYGARYNDFQWHPNTGEFRKYDQDSLGIDFYSSESDIVYQVYDNYHDNIFDEQAIWYGQKVLGFYNEKDPNKVVKLDTAKYYHLIDDIHNAGEIKISGSFNYASDLGQPIVVSPNLDYMYLTNPNHGISKYALPDLDLIKEWDAHQEHVLQILDWGDELLSISNDGDVILWDVTTNPPSEKLRFYGDKTGLFMITPDNYYSATKENIDFVSFRKGNNLIPISSFDLKYNRPDIILEKLNSTDQELINNYQVAYQKRLKRMGITEDQLDMESLPVLNIENFDYLPKFTRDSVVKIFISSSVKLTGAQLWLNGVPQKVQFEMEDDKGFIQTELVNGLNEIEITGTTKSGQNTLPVTYVLEKQEHTNRQNNLYVLSIGVSEYADSTFNLNYANKDAKDVGHAFHQLECFDTVSVFTLTDSDVTAEALPEIKSYLQRATINDVVVIYVAGHGLLDDNFDYYYAVHDVDFNNPGEKGWSYSMIEDLLNICKANKKLLLFDTCHGGEIDKDELAQNEVDNTSEEEVLFRASKTFNYSSNQSNASALSKEFFGDFRKGVGATVIASSGGTEYAAESTTYQNGIFTYFLKKGLVENEADLNNDQAITVNELRIYLNEEVRKATNGHQNPGTRIINDKHQIVLKTIE